MNLSNFSFDEIIKLVGMVTDLFPSIQKIITDLHQSAEMTPDQKTALDTAIAGTVFDPAWKPDDGVPVPPVPPGQ